MKRGSWIFLTLILVISIIGVIAVVSAADNETTIASNQTCADSDGGLNYYIKGSVIVDNGQSYDMCVHKLTETNAQHYASKDGILYDNGCLENNCYVAEAYCNFGVREFDVVSCPNGCSDGACLKETTPTCQPTKCDDGTTYACKMVDGICSCPTCPAKPAELRCIDSDNGQDYYTKGLTKWSVADGSTNQQEDKCIDNQTLYEGYCDSSETYLDGKKAFKIQSYTCLNDCKDGACIKGEQIKEQVTCVFQNSDKEQKCYTAYQNERAVCLGLGSCAASILGYKGEQITWKSSCGGYQYTTIDGNNEEVKFDCKAGEMTTTEIKNRGFTNIYFQCYDGAESKSTDREACKSAEYWKKFATNFCASHCENNPEKCKQKYKTQEDIDKCLGKCGINSFSIGNECYIEGTIATSITTTPVGTECKEDISCQKSCTCAEGEECKCNEAKCIDGKCVIEETNCVKGTEIVNSMEGRKCCAGLIEVMRSDSTFKCMKEETLFCKDSCPLDGKCYQFGYRKEGKFCSDEGNFVEQKKNEACDNNFECTSNVCVSGKCVSSSFIDKIMNWFRKLFGGE